MGVGNGFFGLRVVSVPRRGGRKGGSDPPPARPRVRETAESLSVFSPSFHARKMSSWSILPRTSPNTILHHRLPRLQEVRPSTGGAGRDAMTVMWRPAMGLAEERHIGVGGGGDGGGGDGGGDGGGGDGDGSRKRPLQGGAERGQAAAAPTASATENGQREAPLARAAVLPTATTAAARARVGERRGADHTRAARVAPNEISAPPTPPHPRNSGTPRQPFARGPICPHALPTCVHGDRPNTLGTWRESWNGDGLRPPALRLR